MVRNNVLLATSTALLAAAPALADPGTGGTHGHMWDGGYGGWIIGGFMMLLFWGLIIAAVVLGVRWLSDRNTARQHLPAALDTLKDRLARGEIEPEDYEARRKLLQNE